jgi:SRSO17 transposase
MDAQQIRGLRPMLDRFLKRFDDCFARKDTRAHLSVYVEGQLSDLKRKSVEPIALAADVPVRTLQEFLSQHRWQEDLARDRLQQIVAKEHAHPHCVGILDETSFVKQGDKTPGTYRSKTEIALELLDRAAANGIRFGSLTFDEWYGGKPAFLQALAGRQQPFVAEVPRNLMGWIDAPRVTQRPFHRRRGRGRKVPRIVAGSRPARSAEYLLWWHPALAD